MAGKTKIIAGAGMKGTPVRKGGSKSSMKGAFKTTGKK